MFIAGSLQAVDEPFIHQSFRFLFQLLNLCTFELLVEWCPFLVHQTVGRDVFYVKRQRLVDVRCPVVQCFVGKTEHQVDADVPDADSAQSLDGCAYLLCCMTAMQETQSLIGKRLCTHADAVDGELCQNSYILIGKVIGIALDGDFGSLTIHLINIIEEFLQILSR